jgi:uncharacterized coiled-coil DUF342 family protein
MQKMNNEMNSKLKDVEEQLAASQKNSESLKKKNDSLMAEVKSLKLSKTVDSIPSKEKESKTLNSLIENYEAEKWALNNELRTSQDKIHKMSQQINELQAYQSRYQILQSDMELKQKESSNLSARMIKMESSHSKVNFII